MHIFDFRDIEALGTVSAVDVASVFVSVDDINHVKKFQINGLVVLHSKRPGQYLIGLVVEIVQCIRNNGDSVDTSYKNIRTNKGEVGLIKISLIGTFYNRIKTQKDIFSRILETLPEIGANCFSLEGKRLSDFMDTMYSDKTKMSRIAFGKYALYEDSIAYLDGNNFFQRHALIVGNTGSGKSWTTAMLLEQASSLPQVNAVLFDIHGEYGKLTGHGFKKFKIAGPRDSKNSRSRRKQKDAVLYFPFWMLGYEELISLFVGRNISIASNQVEAITLAILEAKKKTLRLQGKRNKLSELTIDNIIPFDIDDIIEHLEGKNNERIESSRKGMTRAGPNFGRLTDLILRIRSISKDLRLAFLFHAPDDCKKSEWIENMAQELSTGSGAQGGKGGVKIIDFSEVPSDLLPLITGLIARMLFSKNFWTKGVNRHPIVVICDEADLYIPIRPQRGTNLNAPSNVFERIAKEGRKYGVGLVVITQRPSELNGTVLSQCNNVVAMRLTNIDDQDIIRGLLPESLGNFSDLLPILGVGEALVVGDAVLLPARLRVIEPEMKPDSDTVNFWDVWNAKKPKKVTIDAIRAWRRQGI